MPYVQLGERMPGAVRRLLDVVPILKPVLPDPGVPSSSSTTTTSRPRCAPPCSGRGRPGVYNLAGPGEITMCDLADALGWYSVSGARARRRRAAEVVARLPFVPAEAPWLHAARRAGDHGHGQGAARAALAPREHGSRETLDATVAASARRAHRALTAPQAAAHCSSATNEPIASASASGRSSGTKL